MAFFETVKRGAKQLGSDVASKAKQAAQKGPPPARPNEQLTVAYRPNKTDWVVRGPSGDVKRKAYTRSGAANLARQVVASSQKYSQFQVLNKDSSGFDDIVAKREELRQPTASEERGGGIATLAGFTDDGGDRDPYVPNMGGGPRRDEEDNQPFVPESLEDL